MFCLPSPHNLPLAYEFRYLQGEDPLRDAISAVKDGIEQISNTIQLTEWVRGPLRRLIPHEKTLLGFGHTDYSTLSIERVHAVDLAEDYFATTHPNSLYLKSPVLANWMHGRAPQIIHPSKICPRDEHRWHANFKRHQLGNGIFDATISGHASRFCFIKLFNVSGNFEGKINLLSRFVTPRLPDIWRRMELVAQGIDERCFDPISQPCPAITDAERRIIHWLRLGKSNWEIGRILGKSHLTVKTQIQRMLKKTGLKDRYALAAIKY